MPIKLYVCKKKVVVNNFFYLTCIEIFNLSSVPITTTIFIPRFNTVWVIFFLSTLVRIQGACIDSIRVSFTRIEVDLQKKK